MKKYLNAEEYTTIRISQALKELLVSYGNKSESYEDIIWKLLLKGGYVEFNSNKQERKKRSSVLETTTR